MTSLEKALRDFAQFAAKLKGDEKSEAHPMQSNGWSVRDLYRTLETPGANRLRDAHAALDSAVRAAYGMKEEQDPLAFLLRLNLELAAAEVRGTEITAPGLPAFVAGPQTFTTQDCIRADTAPSL